MPLTLSEHLARLRATLGDSPAELWTDDQLTDCLRTALARLDQSLPRQQQAVLTLIPGTPTVDLSSLGQGIRPYAVVYPYDPNEPQKTDRLVPWEFHDSILSLSSIDVILENWPYLLLRYEYTHLISGLDGATSTTLPTAYEAALQVGACAQALSLALIGAVNRAAVNRPYEYYCKAQLTADCLFSNWLDAQVRQQCQSLNNTLSWEQGAHHG